MHDLTIAFTMWGFLDPDVPEDLRERRAALFAGVADTDHHYPEGRAIADMIPEETVRMTPDEVAARARLAGGLVRIKHPLVELGAESHMPAQPMTSPMSGAVPGRAPEVPQGRIARGGGDR